MNVPYDLYVRYLATCGHDDVVTLNDALREKGLRPVAQETLDAHWDIIQSSLPQRVIETIGRKNYTPDFLKHMKVLEIEELWRAHPKFKDTGMKSTVKLVYDVLQDTMMRITVNALLIKKISISEITRMVTTKFSTPLTEKQIGLYARYFFDVGMMTRADWKAYIRGGSDRERRLYFMALTENAEVLKTELELPSVANVGESLQWLFTKSFLKARNFMDVGTPEADRAALMWSDQVVKLADKYEKYRSGDQNDFAKTLQMEFDFVDEPFDTPDSETYKEVTKKSAVKDS